MPQTPSSRGPDQDQQHRGPRPLRSGLPFVQVSPSFYTHRKAKALVRKLQDDFAPDRVVRVWAYFGLYYVDGVAPYDDETVSEIEEAAMWRGQREDFTKALIEVGFLDVMRGKRKRLAVHDWSEWAGSYSARLAKERERMRANRAKAREVRSQNVQSTSAERSHLEVEGKGEEKGEVDADGDRDRDARKQPSSSGPAVPSTTPAVNAQAQQAEATLEHEVKKVCALWKAHIWPELSTAPCPEPTKREVEAVRKLYETYEYEEINGAMYRFLQALKKPGEVYDRHQITLGLWASSMFGKYLPKKPEPVNHFSSTPRNKLMVY